MHRALHTSRFVQGGNILFLILLAVVLFAALAYAVTNSMRGGGKSASAEKDRADASVILQRATMIETAFNRAIMTGGYKDYEIEFGYSSPYLNPNCTSAGCRILDPTTGQVEGTIYLPISMKNPVYPGSSLGMRPLMSAVQGVGTSLPDIILLVEGIRPGICKAINEMLGIAGMPMYSDATPGVAFKYYADTPPAGGFPTTTSAIGEEPMAAALVGQRTGCGCYQADCGNAYDSRFYHVVYAR